MANDPKPARRRRRQFGSDRKSAVSLIFAVLVVPLCLVVALAIDYGFFIQARAQLNLAADAASLYATTTATNAYALGDTSTASEIAAAELAGQQWFTAQLGRLAAATNAVATVNVIYNTNPIGFSSTVSYTAALPTNFGGLLPISLPISGTSTSTVQGGYTELILMVDNSSSMLIGASPSDIVALEEATPCSAAAASAKQAVMPSYIWQWPWPHGYPSSQNGYGLIVPTATPVIGYCDGSYNGPANSCFYLPSTITASLMHQINPSSGYITPTGFCSSGGSGYQWTDYYEELPNTPQAPCAFACHSSATGNDYYAVARATTNPTTNAPVQLRLDVVHQAAATVINTMISSQQFANQFSVGYYEFNSNTTKVYPTSGGEASTNLSGALAAVQVLDPPMSIDTPNTFFGTAFATLNNELTAAGNGMSASSPTKNLFIITDGINDYGPNDANQTITRMTNPASETVCQPFKNKGYNVYVLYTTYYPVPTPVYLDKVMPVITPSGTSDVELAMQACSSGASYYFQATDASQIAAAMTTMIQAALKTPSRITH